MIELGSGAGLVAAAIASILEPPDDILIATDLPEVIFGALFPSHHLIRLGLPSAARKPAIRSACGPTPLLGQRSARSQYCLRIFHGGQVINSYHLQRPGM